MTIQRLKNIPLAIIGCKPEKQIFFQKRFVI